MKDELTGYFIGYMLTDGCYFKGEYQGKYKYNKYMVSGTSKDRDIADKFKQCLNVLFNDNVKIGDFLVKYNGKKLKYNIVKSQKKETYKQVANLLTNIKLEKLNDSIKCNILKGMIDGDGCVSIDERDRIDGKGKKPYPYHTISLAIRFGNTDKKVLGIYKALLNHFNINYREYDRKTHIEIRCQGNSAIELHKIVLPLCNRKEQKILDFLDRVGG